MGFGDLWQKYVAEPVSEAVEVHVVQPFQEHVVEPFVESVVDPFVENVVEPTADFVQENVVEPIVGAAETVSDYVSETVDAFNASPVDGIVHLTPAYMIWRALDPDAPETPVSDLINEIGGSGPIAAVNDAFSWLGDHWKVLAAAAVGLILLVPIVKTLIVKMFGGAILG